MPCSQELPLNSPRERTECRLLWSYACGTRRVDEAHRRKGLSIFLLGEAFRQFIREGIMLVEAQAMQHNAAALGMYHKLGFRQVGQGSVFRKDSEQHQRRLRT